MRHQPLERRLAFRKKMDIAQIIGLINQDKAKEAVELAMKAGISSEDFGLITRHAGDTKTTNILDVTTKLYKQIFNNK